MSEVNLVGLTKPSAYTGCFTASELIAWSARVSNPSNQHNTETAAGLIMYLITHEHWSPFEMVHMTLEIKTTRDIARQILRHRSFSFQEYSQRYADPTKDLNFHPREACLQDNKNRQASHDTDDVRLLEEWSMQQMDVINGAKSAYAWATEHGIAKEQARAVLPEGNTESIILMAGSLRSWIHYCKLRRKWDTQKEHRIIADQCWNIISSHFPDISEAIEQVERVNNIKELLFNTLQSAVKVDKSSEDTMCELKTLMEMYWKDKL